MTESTINKKEKKQKELRKKVFDAATTLIPKIGYDNLPIRTLCEYAGISTGMFYRNFSSKDEILDYYYENAQEAFDREVWEKISGLPVDEQLTAYYRWLCEYTESFGVDFVQNLYNSKNKIMRQEIYNNKVIGMTNRCLNRAIEKGFVISGGRTPMDVSTDLCMITKGVIFEWCAHNGSFSLSDKDTELLKRVLPALL